MGKRLNSKSSEFITTNFLFDDSIKSWEKDSLLETGVIDSTGVLELVAFIEETYGIKIDDEEIVPENLDRIINIAAYISQKLSQTASARSSLGS